MATTPTFDKTLVDARMACAYSKAVEASRPLVALSQQYIEALAAKASAMETLFLCPPETPRTKSINKEKIKAQLIYTK